ncbi:hypothetical protein J8I26_15735, partial [Herbaspirillum sp. LeCh32-8]|uniref:hypothetical protein n=1 Tax=Herbaspirillum sp. LeCh32-8 TaxID=2821356 RepID=UPI001AE3920D
DCGLNMGQLRVQISWKSGSVFSAIQQHRSSKMQDLQKHIAISLIKLLTSEKYCGITSTSKLCIFVLRPRPTPYGSKQIGARKVIRHRSLMFLPGREVCPRRNSG